MSNQTAEQEPLNLNTRRFFFKIDNVTSGTETLTIKIDTDEDIGEALYRHRSPIMLSYHGGGYVSVTSSPSIKGRFAAAEAIARLLHIVRAKNFYVVTSFLHLVADELIKVETADDKVIDSITKRIVAALGRCD